MNTTIARPPITKASLENEVLVSVVLLYFVISSALLLIHHLQPEDAVTQTSSPSPSHAGFHVTAATGSGAQLGSPVEPVGPQHWLVQAGYADVRDLQWDGERWQATAEKNGQRWMLQIDPRPVIVATPAPAVPTR